MKKITLDGIILDWPAVCVSIGGREYRPDSETFENDVFRLKVRLEKRGNFWFKRLEVTAKRVLPTPDFVEVDRQTVPDSGLRMCGYVATGSHAKRQGADEEGGGLMPGCGYPLIGRRIFTGLAHPAGFNRIESRDAGEVTYALRHHPVWTGTRLESIEAVFGVSDHPEEEFFKYIESIRAPLPLEPFFAFCSFWSDPYLGNYEYAVTGESMSRFIDAFHRLGLASDAFTFDAGWQNRKSFFKPKKGLEFENYPDLSLWISHNGPMGIDPDFLRKNGIAVGGGESAAYCGDDYGVLLDPKLEKALTKRFCELARHARHFKIDWDNECAVSREFKEKYPTRDHVREGSINAMFRIVASVRKVRPDILIRNGWWPSPWWLTSAHHVFLSNSGDSEYASLPSFHQRASAATHRDLMYYNHLRRDHSMIPLSSFDNHEFPNSIRNVFLDDDASWTDNLMLCLLRGSTYFSWTIQPESLTPYRAETMKRAMRFARDYADRLFVRHGRMFGGNPGLGEVYGFIQSGEESSWGVLRNPSPMPQRFQLPDGFRNAIQFYPDFRKLDETVLLLPEEVKVFLIPKRKAKLSFLHPFQIRRNGKEYEYHFPASKVISAKLAPSVSELHRIPELKFENVSFENGGENLFFDVIAPYRMNPLYLQLKLIGKKLKELRIQAVSSRYYGKHPGSNFVIPITEISGGNPGHGELKNPETIFQEDERFFRIPVPPGGRTSIILTFSRTIRKEDLEIWCVGYEPASFGCLKRKHPPEPFTASLPLSHPDGFPHAVKLEFQPTARKE